MKPKYPTRLGYNKRNMYLFAETFDAIARIENSSDRANQHLETVQSLYFYNQPEAAVALVPETLGLVRGLSDIRQKLFLLRKVGVLLAKMQRFADAFTVADEIDLLLLEPDFINSSRAPDEVEEQKDILFHVIALQQAFCREFDDVHKTLERIVDFDEYENAIVEIIESSSTWNDIRKNEEVLDGFLELLETPYRKASALIHLALIFPVEGSTTEPSKKIEQVIQIINTEISDDGIKDTLLKKLLNYYSITSNFEKWFASNRKISDPAMRCDANLSQITKYGGNTCGDEPCEKLLQTVLDDVKQIDDSNAKIQILTDIAFYYGRYLEDELETKKYYREAIRLVSLETNPYSRVKLSLKICNSLADAEQRTAAAKMFQKTISFVESVDDIHLRCYLLREIAGSFVANDFYNEAKELAKNFENYAVPDEHDRAEVEAILVYQKCLASIAVLSWGIELKHPLGDIPGKTLELIRSIPDPIERADALRKLAELSGWRSE